MLKYCFVLDSDGKQLSPALENKAWYMIRKNKRIDWCIEKSHSNDAICITDLEPNSVDIFDWIIKPIRRQSKAKTDNVLGIKHRDLVSYTCKNGKMYVGYVTALYPESGYLNFQGTTKHYKNYNAKNCKLLWRYNKIYWLCPQLT